MKRNSVLLLITKFMKLALVISIGRNSVFENYFIQTACRKEVVDFVIHVKKKTKQKNKA